MKLLEYIKHVLIEGHSWQRTGWCKGCGCCGIVEEIEIKCSVCGKKKWIYSTSVDENIPMVTGSDDSE